MEYTVIIKYATPHYEEVRNPLNPVAPQFELGISYVDDEKFRKGLNDTAYTPNNWDNGDFKMAQTLEKFVNDITAHKNVFLAFKAAAKDGKFKVVTEDYQEYLYVKECINALAGEGFSEGSAETSVTEGP